MFSDWIWQPRQGQNKSKKTHQRKNGSKESKFTMLACSHVPHFSHAFKWVPMKQNESSEWKGIGICWEMPAPSKDWQSPQQCRTTTPKTNAHTEDPNDPEWLSHELIVVLASAVVVDQLCMQHQTAPRRPEKRLEMLWQLKHFNSPSYVMSSSSLGDNCKHSHQTPFSPSQWKTKSL